MFLEDTIDEALEDGWNPKPPHGENERQGLRSHDAFLVNGHVRRRSPGSQRVEFRTLQHRIEPLGIQVRDVGFMTRSAYSFA
jgi:hypothetical protein